MATVTATTERAGSPPADNPGADSPAIELTDISKTFPGRNGGIQAVSGVSLAIRRGEIFGLLGPNGAGKSTTIRIIATLLEPTTGSVQVCGIDALRQPQQARRHIGAVLGGERSVYWKLTARQNLEYFAALYGMPRRSARTRITQLLDRFGLGDRADDFVERYSTGMRQRLIIARAMLHDPAVLLLDEPTLGLDPQAAQLLHDSIGELRAAGHAIVLTTHYLEEADALSDRLAIVDHGKIVARGTALELKRATGAAQTIRLRLRSGDPADLSAVLGYLGEKATVSTEPAGDATTVVLRSADDEDLVPWIIAVCGSNRVTVVKIDVEPVSLRDVFLEVTGRELEE